MGPPPPVSPYKGLMPFDDSERDALLFFGRGREREIAAGNLMASRLTVLYGPSGVGKSSLLRAGVVHELRAQARRNLEEGGSPELAIAVFSAWRDDPVEGLLDAVAEAVEDLLGEQAPVAPELSFTDELDAWATRVGGELYIVLDQFDEYFLYHGNEDGPGTFAVEFPEAVNRRGLRVHFLVGLREDALAKLDVFKGRIPNLFANYLRLDRLDEAAAREAILGPIAELNRLSGNGSYDVEPVLVGAVIREVAAGRIDPGLSGRGVVHGAEETGRVEAPYLQLVLQRIWEVETAAGSYTLHLETLNDLGGAEQVVEDHLELALDALTPAEKDAAARIFGYLVTPSGTKIAHDVGDLARYASVNQGELDRVIAVLEAERILRPLAGAEEEGRRYEIFHDVLAAAVLAWTNRYEAQRALEQERSAAQRRHRRVLAAMGIALVLLAAMTAIAAYAISQRGVARSQARLAQVQRGRAERATTRAKAAANEAHKQAGRAVAKSKEAQRQKAIAVHQRQVAQQQTAKANQATQAEQQQTVKANQATSVAQQQTVKANQATTEANKQKKIAQTQATNNRASALAAQAAALMPVNPERSVSLALQSAALHPTGQVESVLRTALVAMRERAVLPSGGGPVTGASFSPDGSVVAVAGGTTATAGVRRPAGARTAGSGEARIYRTATGALIRVLQRGAAVNSISFSLDGRTVVTAGADGNARLWSTATWKLLHILHHDGPVRSASFSKDGSLVVTAGDDKTARVWSVDSGQPVSIIHLDGPVSSASFSPDGHTVVTVGSDPQGHLTARLYDASTGAFLIALDERGITSATFSPDGKLVATTSNDRTARVWDARSGALVRTFPETQGHVVAAVFSADGSRLLTSNDGSGASLWDVASGQRVLFLVGQTNAVTSASFSPDGKFFLVSSLDRSARIYRAIDGYQVAILLGHTGGVTGAAFSPDGRMVVTAGDDGTARLWDPGTEDQLEPLGSHDKAVAGASFSPDGKLVVSASADGTARIWSLAGRRQLQVLRHDGPVSSAAFSLDGKLVVTASSDKTARIWRVADGAQLRVLHHDAAVSSARFSEDGKLVVTASADGTARIWRVADGAQLNLLSQGSPVSGAEFSRDGTLVVTAGSDDKARLWSTSSGALLHVLRGHRGAVATARFSRDGRLVVTSSADDTARLWSARTGGLLHVLRGHTQGVTDAEFSRDGKFVVTSSVDHDARIWSVASGKTVKVLRGHFSAVQQATFSTDGKWVVTAGPFTVGLWPVAEGRLFSPSGLVNDPFLRGPTATVTSVAFSPDGKTLLSTSADGTVRTFRCDVCGALPSLVALAKARLARLPH